MNIFELFWSRKEELLSSLWIHIEITVLAMLVAILIAVPLGILLSRHKKYAELVIGITGVIQTVPSLALLGFMIPLFGIGLKPALIALVLYALLPILRNTFIGISEVSPAAIEAGNGMGMTRWQLLYMVQLPIALPVLIGGIRTSAVWTVGVATLGALIGAGGLGDFIFRGIATANNNLILMGAVPAALLAIFFDTALRLFETSQRIENKGKKTGRFFMYFAIAVLIAVLAGIYAPAGSNKMVTVGGKNFTEQDILVEILSQTIEENTDIQVVRKPFLGGTSVVESAMDRGDVDIYAEYTGTALLHILKLPLETDPDKAYEIVRNEYSAKKDVTWLKPLGFNNTYTLTMRADQATELGIEKISDLVAHGSKLHLGCTAEFTERPDGYPGLVKKYNFEFSKLSVMDPGLVYSAVRDGEVDVIDAFATDGRIPAFGLKVLKDDKQFFPPYYAAPIVRNDALHKYPELKELLNRLAGKLTDEEMAKLNAQVDLDRKSAAEVAKNWLKEQKII